MANTTNIDEIVREVNVVQLASKKNPDFKYDMLQLVLDSGEEIRMMLPTFDTGKLLRQEVELAKLRGGK